MSTSPTLGVSPASPDSGDLVLLTASGTVPEGSTIVVTGSDGSLQTSVPFGLGDIPLGTGDSEYTLKVVGGTTGTFELNVYEYGDGVDGSDVSATDPIYYHNDAPTYAYPDMDDVADALEAALPGADVTVTRSGATMTVLIGGKYSGRRVSMVAGTKVGAETITIAEITKTGGPFLFGPLMLADDDYVADLKDGDGDTLLSGTTDFTVG